jgi:ubiquitin carboxyl-terminal hydrolase 8
MTDYSKYAGKGLSGLKNIGNTCYANSVMKILFFTHELNEAMMNFKPTSTIEDQLLKEYLVIYKIIWKKNCNIIPGGFVGKLKHLSNEKHSNFSLGIQNDASEMLSLILDSFHISLKREVVINIQGDVKTQNDAFAKKAYETIKAMYEKEYSPILELFYGVQVSQLLEPIKEDDEYTDTPRKILSFNTEPINMFSLEIPNKNESPNLYDCFSAHCSEELITGENKWFNEETGKYEDVVKQVRFFSLPDILLISFKRFDNNMKKNNIFVDFPIENMSMIDYIVGYDKYNYIYDLYGVINHSGNVDGGHYNAVIKNDNGEWYCHDDKTISKINVDNVVSSSAYCLAYRKRK